MDETPGLVTGTYNTPFQKIDCHSLDVSALGENFEASPMVLPIRGCLDSVKRLLKGDLYIWAWVSSAFTDQEQVL